MDKKPDDFNITQLLLLGCIWIVSMVLLTRWVEARSSRYWGDSMSRTTEGLESMIKQMDRQELDYDDELPVEMHTGTA